MTWTASSESQAFHPAFHPEPSFTEAPVSVAASGELSALGVQAQAHGYLWVQLAPPGPQHRGRLGLYIEESIESCLEERGALPPGIQASTGLDASLSDQLYRARLVEMRGLALGVPSLEGITNLGRALDAEDSGVLRWWLAATAERPVRVVLGSENMRLRVYPSPVLFETLFEVAPEPVSPRAPSVSMAESAETMALSELPPDVSEASESDEDVVSFAEEPSHDELNDLPVQAGPQLPALDRALGLDGSVAAAWEAPSEPLNDSFDAQVVEPVPAEMIHEEAIPALPVQTSTDWQQPGDAEPQHFEAEQPAPTAPAAPVAMAAPIQPAPVQPAPIQPAPIQVAPAPAAPVAAPRWRSDSTERLDAAEFLRALEEDSARVPAAEAPLAAADFDAAAPESDEVESDERESADLDGETYDAPHGAAAYDEAVHALDSDEPTIAPEPSVLPTKVIRRTPFIRMAEPDEQAAPRAVAAFDRDELASPELGEEPPAAGPTGSAFLSSQPALPAQREPQPLDESDPFVQLARRDWKTWAKNLEAARGPKPLAVVERQFVTDYTRLREALRRGVADRSAAEVLDAWQASFATSYSEAFDALRVRGKRPTMVLDVPEIAQRLGRLQGARRVQLLLVDGMRFDLGLMIQERLRARVDAALTERLLLWSALPSITTYQLELLGKGPEGLRDECSLDESPALVARGRAAAAPRRIRTGRLELFKIDVVEDALREPGLPIEQRLPEIAERTSEALADHLSKQAPRTLVLVFGDHGFALDPRAAGTTAEVRQGGSTPEEVLVPAFAWLTGAVH